MMMTSRMGEGLGWRTDFILQGRNDKEIVHEICSLLGKPPNHFPYPAAGRRRKSLFGAGHDKCVELIFPDSKLGSLAKTMLVGKCLQYGERPSACSCTEELSVFFDR